MSWWLLLFLFFAYVAMLLASACEKAVEDVRNPLPGGGKRGTSCVPVIPIFPLVAWGCASLLDQLASDWGTWVIGGLHAALMAVAVGVGAFNLWRLRSLKRVGSQVMAFERCGARSAGTKTYKSVE